MPNQNKDRETKNQPGSAVMDYDKQQRKGGETIPSEERSTTHGQQGTGNLKNQGIGQQQPDYPKGQKQEFPGQGLEKDEEKDLDSDDLDEDIDVEVDKQDVNKQDVNKKR